MTSFVSSLLFQPFVKLTWNHDLFTVFQCPDSIVNEGYTIICPVRSHFCLHIMHVRMCVLTHTLLCMWRKILHRNMFPSIIIFTLKMGLSVIVSSFCSFLFSVFPQYASVACVIKNYFRKPFSSFVYNISVRPDTHPLVLLMVIYLNGLFEMALIFGKCWDNWVTYHISGKKMNKKPQRNRWRSARQRSGSYRKVFGSRYMYVHELSWNFLDLWRGWI